MNVARYEQVTEILSELDYAVTPRPEPGEDLKFFDVRSEDGEISPAKVLNAIYEAAHRDEAPIVRLVAAQPNCLTLEDLYA